jgi:flavin-binding protein dodecin
MVDHAYKMIQVVGVSKKSYADATAVAVKRAAKSLHGLAWFEAKEFRGRIEGNKIAEFQVKVDIGFRLDD